MLWGAEHATGCRMHLGPVRCMYVGGVSRHGGALARSARELTIPLAGRVQRPGTGLSIVSSFPTPASSSFFLSAHFLSSAYLCRDPRGRSGQCQVRTWVSKAQDTTSPAPLTLRCFHWTWTHPGGTVSGSRSEKFSSAPWGEEEEALIWGGEAVPC